ADGHSLSAGIILDLIPADLAHIKIRRLGMRKIQPADGGRRVHCEALGQLNTGRPLGIQKLPDERLFRVIRTGWIPRRGPDAPIFFENQLVVGQVFVGGVSPELAPNAIVKHLGERLGQPVGQSLDHDLIVVVVLALELGDDLLDALAGRDGERAYIVGATRFARRDKIGQRTVRMAGRLLRLLPQRVEGTEDLRPTVVGVQLDIIPNAVRRPDAHHTVTAQESLPADAIQQRVRVIEQLPGFGSDIRQVEYFRVLAFELPRNEERRPVDEWSDVFDRYVSKYLHPKQSWRGDGHGIPIARERVSARLLVTQVPGLRT